MNALFTIVLGIIGAIAAVKPEKILKPAILENPTRVKIVRIAGGGRTPLKTLKRATGSSTR